MRNIPRKKLRLFDMVVLKKPDPELFVIGEIVGVEFNLDSESEHLFLYIQDLLSGKEIELLSTDVAKIDIAKIHNKEILC